MSGRGSDQQPGGNPLGGKIKEELLSALRLLFKSAEQHAVDVALSCDFTAFITEISCTSESVGMQPPQPHVSADVIQGLAKQVPTRALKLIESTGLAQGAPCEWQSVLCSEPVFDEMQFAPIDVAFDNMTQTPMGVWPVQRMTASTKNKSMGKIAPPAVKDLADAKPLTTKLHSLAEHLPKVSVKNNPRLYALPIRKASIPPHRFSMEARETFRQALAEKVGTHAGNVQLKMIYERMNMGLYSAIQVDDTGSLMCTPKSELLGRNAEMAGRANQLAVGSESSYLVLGVRLDTKADIRALVPVESVMNAPDDGLPGA